MSADSPLVLTSGFPARKALPQRLHCPPDTSRRHHHLRRTRSRNARAFFPQSNHRPPCPSSPSSCPSQTHSSALSQIISVQQTKMAGPSSSIFRQTLVPHTRSILFSLLTSIGGGVPRSHLSSLSELLHACVLRMLEETRVAVRELLSTPGWPTSTTTDESKAKFERAVMRFV